MPAVVLLVNMEVQDVRLRTFMFLLQGCLRAGDVASEDSKRATMFYLVTLTSQTVPIEFVEHRG